MNRTLTFAMTAIVIFLVTSPSLRADEPSFSDDFSTVTGFFANRLNSDYTDSGGERACQTHVFMDESITGELQLTIREDDKSVGPDGEPGVLALSFDSIPEDNSYCGFVYLGTTDNLIKLPGLDGKFGESDLEQVEVSFQYKAANKNNDDIGLEVNCRFEAETEASYESRIDFGALKATEEWQEFKMTLSAGTNKEEFVKAVNELTDRSFKLVWGQEGPIANYEDGDTLLIDDLKITVLNK